MLGDLWNNAQWRALVAGFGYVVVYALLGRGRWRAERSWQENSLGRMLVEVASLLGAVIYPLGMMLLGAFSPTHLGLSPVSWGRVLPALGLSALLMSAWVTTNWGFVQPSERARTSLLCGGSYALSVVGTLPRIVEDEGWLATSRAVLMPLLGPYWGVWAAPLLRMLVSNTSPEHHAALRWAPDRRRLYLDFALDWVSSAVWIAFASLWPALLVRAICRIILHFSVAPQPPPCYLRYWRHPVRRMATVHEPVSDSLLTE